jgi:nicotinamide phosphoribosyltransferase
MINPITLIDGYKLDHRRQYPDKTEYVYSNWTPRGSRVDGIEEVTLFGLQYFLDRYLQDEFHEFFTSPVDAVCAQYARRVNGYLGPNNVGTDHIRALHDLGYLPLEFCAIPEGSSVPLRVPMLTVVNTHPDFAWLVNYFETLMSNVLWLPCTSATTAKHFRKMLDYWARRTGTDQAFVDWQGHDFSFRGMAGPEAAALSGAGHLISFTGTDTIPAIDMIEDYYPTDSFIAGSVAATEHSVMCAGGEKSEMETFLRLMDLYPEGVLSVVSDTWDFWGVLTEILPQIKDQVLARNGKLVIRPDSGDPVKIICGDPNAVPGTPAYYGAVELLWKLFGGTTTDAGYKLLDGHVGVIYGDSITYERGEAILSTLAQKGFASGNVVLGIGSYTYQYVTRDTFGFAMKATWVQIDGEGMAIFKDPKTDNGLKKSAKGRLAVLDLGPVGVPQYFVIDEATPEQEAASLLQPVWKDGKFIKTYTFDEVRANAKA